MRQTVEQAAREYAEEHGGFYPQGIVTDKVCEEGFLAGAAWQRRQGVEVVV